MFHSRAHRSTKAPDGRLVTEFDTKWCNTCARRLPHEEFPTKMVRRKTGYVTRLNFYCHRCMVGHLEEMNQWPNVKERARARAREAYENPILRQRQLEANRRRYRERKADPQRHAEMKEKARRARITYLERLRQDPERWAKHLKAQEDRNRRAREDRLQRRLEQLDPLVLRPGDPMRDWLYQQCAQYADERDMSLRELFPNFDLTKWKSSNGHGARYMRFALVDEILVRLDLQHRLDDFTFYRRSELSGRVPREIRSRCAG
jgi:hypothetical protein